MKRAFFFLLATALLYITVGCQQKQPMVTAKVNLPDGTIAYLCDLALENAAYIDTTKVQNGTITFTKQRPEGLYAVEAQQNFWVVVLGDKPATIDATARPIKYEGEAAAILNAYSQLDEDYTSIIIERKDKLADLEKKTELNEEEKETFAKLQNEIDNYVEELKNKMYDLVKQNPNNLYSLYLASMIAPSGERLKDYESYLAAWDAKYADNPLLKRELQYVATEKRLQRNQPFLDLKVATENGDSVQLSEFVGKGKPVLLEVWASWCKACRQSMPKLIEVYNKYKDKGFVVFCVSQDQTPEPWKEAVEKDALPWNTNYIYTDMMSPRSPSMVYNCMSLPLNVLFDGAGKIVDRNIAPEDVEKRLDMIYSLPAGAEIQWEGL